jgi:NitT/TauT family transport system substrate-binding protein
LGFDKPLPNLGLVFKNTWAKAHEPALNAFLKVAAEAREKLCSDDAAWGKVVALTQEKDPALQGGLRKEYCAGLVKHWTQDEQQAVAKTYEVLYQTGGAAVTGKAAHLPGNIFWPYTLE